MKKTLYILFFSCLISQGMYVNKESITVYSLNVDLHSMRNDNLDTPNNYWGIGLSSVIIGINEYSIHYQKKENSESIETLYNYYIKPDFYLKMRYGISSRFIKNYDNTPNMTEYSTRLSLYGNNSSKKDGNTLNFYPILSYQYFVSENDTYDVLKFGLSILFNDIGIEPSYSYISKDVGGFSLKLHLWEFNSY